MKKKLLYIGNKLSKHGNTATSIETLGAFLEREGYTIYYASSFKNKLLRLFHMVVATLYYRKKVDYVMIDTYSTQNFWFAYIVSQLCRWTKRPYITKLHGGDLPSRLKKSPKCCDQLFMHAYCITAPSNYLYEAFLSKYPAHLILLPNTIDLTMYTYHPRSVQGPRLLWVRSFSKIYNPKMAIDVLGALISDFPNAELCMVGPDKDDSLTKYKAYAQDLGLTVTFTGKLRKEEWIKRSKDFDIFINTTHFDNTPVSVIEAMALGLPVVSTNVGGIPNLIENEKHGLLVADSDTVGMANAIRRLVQDPQLVEALQRQARAKVTHYDWHEIKNYWFALLS